MSKYMPIVIFLLFHVLNQSIAGPQPSFDIEKLNIKVGMKRSVLESNIAKYSNLKSNYSAQHPTKLPTSKSYVIDTIILHIAYKNGTPAPYINNGGKTAHLKAIEQTVLSWGMDE